MPSAISQYWMEYKKRVPFRQLCAVYWAYRAAQTRRNLRPFSIKCFSVKLKHRIALLWSYYTNRRCLIRQLKQEKIQGCHRPVVVISQVVHMGDIVACEPIVRQVRRVKPEAFIVFALHRDYRELVDSHPEIDHVLPLACVSEWCRFATSGLFGQVIDLNMAGRACNICGVSWRKPEGDRGVSFENYYLYGNLLTAHALSAGLIPPVDSPRVYLGDQHVITVNGLTLPGEYVCLHARSNDLSRDIPVSAWQDVVSHINAHWHLPVVEIGLKSFVICKSEKGNRSLCGRLSILDSAEVIRRSILYLGVDSGPAHLANAVGSFGIIVLGHYGTFRRYLPYSGNYAHGINCELLYHDGPVVEMPVSRITKAVDRRLHSVRGVVQ